MTQIPAEYNSAANYFARWINAATIKQRATRIALKKVGLSDDDWKAAMDEASGSIGVMPFPESNTKTLEEFLQAMLKHLSDT
jgi:hypothetical protein